jgi:hypothetical protein
VSSWRGTRGLNEFEERAEAEEDETEDVFVVWEPAR